MDDQTREELNTIGEMTRDEDKPTQPNGAEHVEEERSEAQQEGADGDGQEAVEAPPVASIEAEMHAEIERLREEAAANLDGWQRARAEFANYKKRSEAERQQQMILTSVRIIEKLLPVIDDFNRALANLPEELKGDGWVEGVRLLQRKLYGVLEDEGVKEIAVAPGDTFDPAIHEALSHEDSDEFDEGQIIAQLQKGYRSGERVLRPALVRVAR
jgi:molecular chaperone GrpE